MTGTAPEPGVRADGSPSPRVSVCVLTFNHAPFIRQAIDSVLEQRTGFAWELVVGDDGSTDGTGEIVAEYVRRCPDRVRALLHERNVGPHQNTLQTLAACRGEYVALLEGDDYWTDPEKLQVQVDRLDAEPGAALCFHASRVVPEDGSTPWVIPRPHEGPFTLEGLLRRNFVPTASAVFRRSCFGGFPGWYTEVLTGDWLLHVLVAGRGSIVFIPRTMAVYRLSARSQWSRRGVAARIRRTLPLFERLEEVVDPRHRHLVRATRRRLRAWLLLEQLTGGRFHALWTRFRGRA